MQAEIRLYATFRRYLPEGSSDFSFVTTFEGLKTAADLVGGLGLPEDMPKIFIVGGSWVDGTYPVKDGDIISVFPPIGGG